MKKLSILLLSLLLLAGCGSKTYSGKIEVSKGARDEEFNIVTDSPLLYREVEMLQWYEDETGVKQVFANYPIESFTKDGVEYVNPEFPIESKIFVGESTLGNVELSEEMLKALMFSDIANVEIYKELPLSMRSDIDLIVYDDSYVTASNDWKIGELRITFKYINDDSSFTVKGGLTDNKLVLSSDSEITK